MGAGGDDEPGSLGYRDEASYSRRAQQERHSNAASRASEAASQRHQAGALGGRGNLGRGVLVRHPQFGMGRIGGDFAGRHDDPGHRAVSGGRVLQDADFAICPAGKSGLVGAEGHDLSVAQLEL